MDRRTNIRVDQPQPSLGSRLRALRNDRCGIHPPRHDPHHAQATCCKCLVMNPNFPDGLLQDEYIAIQGIAPRQLLASARDASQAALAIAAARCVARFRSRSATLSRRSWVVKTKRVF